MKNFKLYVTISLFMLCATNLSVLSFDIAQGVQKTCNKRIKDALVVGALSAVSFCSGAVACMTGYAFWQLHRQTYSCTGGTPQSAVGLSGATFRIGDHIDNAVKEVALGSLCLGSMAIAGWSGHTALKRAQHCRKKINQHCRKK